MRYQAVVHKWFVSSKGFAVIDLGATTRKAAEMEADSYCHRNSESCCRMAAFVIEAQRPAVTEDDFSDEAIERAIRAIQGGGEYEEAELLVLQVIAALTEQEG